MNLEKKVDARRAELEVFLPDTRGVWSRWGRGNLKIGPNVYTYSKLPGRPTLEGHGGTCPGASPECLSVCYAFRIQSTPLVWSTYEENTRRGADLPELPADAKIVRVHVSGDFDTVEYVGSWVRLAATRREVQFFAYTRSWRVPDLLPALERLRALSNFQLFASMDRSIPEPPPAGWRVSWLENDDRRLGAKSLLCPETTGEKANCEQCRYCFVGQRNDVTFPIH